MSNAKNLKRLVDVAELRTGFTFRGKIEEVQSGNAQVVQIKDVRQSQAVPGNDSLVLEHLPQILWEGRSNAFIEPNTVLLPSRGGYFRATFAADVDGKLPVVASSQFLLLTAKSSQVMPEFLCWSLNQPQMQRYIEEIASQGSRMPMLSTAAARELTLEIPPLATQNKILRLNRLWVKEQQLTQQLLKNREHMLQGMYQQLLKEQIA